MTLDTQHTPQPLLYLTSWIKAGSLCEVNALSIFEEVGIEINLAQIQRTTIRSSQLVQVIHGCSRAAHAVGKSHYPLVLGQVLVFDYAPAAEAFLASSPTLRHALGLIDLVMPKVNPWLKIKLHELDDEAWVTFELPFLQSGEPPLRYVIESTMSAIMHISLNLLGTAHKPLAVHFQHAQPSYHEHYAQHFKVEPRYGQARNAIFFEFKLLDQPLPGAKVHINNQALNILINEQQPQKRPLNFCQEVVDKLISQPDLLSRDLNSIAQSFGLSSRTLQRRLSKEGRGYSDAMKTAQKTLAMRWLADTNMNIDALSTRLGYQSRRAFTSAFKQWTGVTPTRYRSQSKR